MCRVWAAASLRAALARCRSCHGCCRCCCCGPKQAGVCAAAWAVHQQLRVNCSGCRGSEEQLILVRLLLLLLLLLLGARMAAARLLLLPRLRLLLLECQGERRGRRLLARQLRLEGRRRRRLGRQRLGGAGPGAAAAGGGRRGRLAGRHIRPAHPSCCSGGSRGDHEPVAGRAVADEAAHGWGAAVAGNTAGEHGAAAGRSPPCPQRLEALLRPRGRSHGGQGAASKPGWKLAPGGPWANPNAPVRVT